MWAAECLVLWYGGGLPREATSREIGRIGVGSARGRDRRGLGVFRVGLFEEDRAADNALFFRMGYSELATSVSDVFVFASSSIEVTELVEST